MQRILIPYDLIIKNVLYTFGKKSLAVMGAGFLTMGLGLTTAQTAHAGTYNCPDGLTLVDTRTVYEKEPDSNEYVITKVIFICSNSDRTVTRKIVVIYQ